MTIKQSGGIFGRSPTFNTVEVQTSLTTTTASVSGDLTIADKIVHSSDTNTAIRFPAADTVTVETAGTERLRVTSNGSVGFGVTPATNLHVNQTGAVAGEYGIRVGQSGFTSNFGAFNIDTTGGRIMLESSASYPLAFDVNGTERARITSTGSILVGTQQLDVGFWFDRFGCVIEAGGQIHAAVSSDSVAVFNRNTSDGTIVELRQAGTQEGSISVSGTTVSYNGGHLSRWAQFPDNSRPELLKGTVMSNLDQMSQWGEEDNEQLNCVQVSTVEGDANVAGVFVTWDNTEDDYNDILLGMTGDMVIRIGAGVTVARGDLLMSAGDGTAKPQGDDIVRSKTIAKVTSNHVSHTYADGSYCVPCVLMAC